ncbi:MAG: hypothetical protein GX851_04700 [Clostridiales bacterium]|nr:hypothetical protein [Clostridiales bacterium]
MSLLALAAVQILAHTGVVSPITSEHDFADFWNAFIAGAAAGLSLLIVIGVIMNLRALRSEEALKKLYVKETDEREKLISFRGKSAGASACLFCMVIAAIIGGFFSMTVFFTLIANVFALSFFMFFGKLYYNKKL